jgi:hypothetical protein
MRRRYNGGEVFDQVLAGAATGEMGARRFRHRRPTLLLEDDFHFFTQHDRSLR